MSIKNTRVRIKDIKAGAIIYVAHPVYGIEKVQVLSRPFKSKTCTNSSLMNVNVLAAGLFNEDQSRTWAVQMLETMSLNDNGILPGHGYNGRRSFKKLKQAKQWMVMHGKDPQFIKQHELHERCNNEYIFD